MTAPRDSVGAAAAQPPTEVVPTDPQMWFIRFVDRWGAEHTWRMAHEANAQAYKRDLARQGITAAVMASGGGAS